MVSDFIYSLEPYIMVLIVIHTTISLILSIILSRFVTKRFLKDTNEVRIRDKARLDEIENRGMFFKLFFRVSLHKNNRITNIIFIFLFNISMPVIGYISSIWITYYLKTVSYEKKVVNTNILNLDEFGMSFLKVERIFGEGSMSDLMVSQYAPKSKKLKALSSLANNPSPANLKIIRQALTSTDDEIRMFGYAIINKAEKSLNIKINLFLDIFNKLNEKEEEGEEVAQERINRRGKRERIAEAAKELAPLYWEMVYTELSHESLKDSFLKEVTKYINVAKEFYLEEIHNIQKSIEHSEIELQEIALEERKRRKEEISEEEYRELEEKRIKAEIKEKKIVEGEKKTHIEIKKDAIEALDFQQKKLAEYNAISTRLYILMGRVYVKKGDYDNANTEFTIAQELHTVESSFILPYLAEIHYLTGNYKVVSSIMNKATDLELNPTLFPIVEQWRIA